MQSYYQNLTKTMVYFSVILDHVMWVFPYFQNFTELYFFLFIFGVQFSRFLSNNFFRFCNWLKHLRYTFSWLWLNLWSAIFILKFQKVRLILSFNFISSIFFETTTLSHRAKQTCCILLGMCPRKLNLLLLLVDCMSCQLFHIQDIFSRYRPRVFLNYELSYLISLHLVFLWFMVSEEIGDEVSKASNL